jgi:hypothetical protein
MEYVLNGEIVTGRMVEVDGIKYPRQAFADVPGMIPVKETPTLEDGQTFEWNSGSEVDGEWVRFVVRNKTTDEKMAEIRGTRDNLLSDTDWTGMSDVTMSADMVTYRQALRDLPATVSVDSPVYPTKP